MTIIDANYILRWFLNDVQLQATLVDTLIRGADSASVVIDRVTIAEVTYVLRAKQYDHQQIFRIFEELYYYPSVVGPSEIDKVALGLYRDTSLDFEDCVLIAHSKLDGYTVGTFDKDLRKLVS